ncbi:MAG: MFS transporter, partial [Treponema sp.]|nr:MFS transporter [Treponema sp.]
SFINLGLPDSLLGAAWPSMYGFLEVPLHYAGYISMIMAVGRILSSLICEKIVRRLGTGTVITVSFFLLSAALLGFSFSSSFFIICLWSIPLCLGAGFIDVTLNNYVALNYKAKHMSWLHCFWGIGASIGPIIISYYLFNKNSWSMGYRAIGIIQCCFTVILIISFSLWEKNKSAAGIEEKKPVNVKYSELFRTAGIIHILVVFFCYVSIQISIVLWGSSFLVQEKNISPETAARWISLFYIGLTAGRFISGFLTMQFNNRQMVRIGHGLIALGVIALVVPLGNIFLMSGFFILGLGCAPIYPCLLHETPKNFGSEKSQAFMGIQMACAFTGALIVPPLFGGFTSFTGFMIYPVFIGIFLSVNIVMFEIFNRKVDKANTRNERT